MKKSKDEIQSEAPYKDNWLTKIPSWLIILLLKYWAAAAAVFFSVIGGLDIGLDFDKIDETNMAAVLAQDIALIVLIGLFLALFTNYLIRPVIRMMNNRQTRTYRYNMINMKGLISFLIALVYNLIISIIIYFIIYFLGMHGWVFNPFGTTNYGIEPFSYGLYYILIDFIFLGIKNLIIYTSKRLKYRRDSIREDIGNV